jgi:molybdopterin-guanine dinucleotide biosynthesis protein B
MKVFTIIGYTNTGKTSTILKVIEELTRRGKNVNAVKSVHIEGFTIETEGKDSWLHWKAGAETTAIRADGETSIIYRKTMSAAELMPFFKADFLVMEGFKEEKDIPKIICAADEEQIKELMDDTVFAIAGVVSNKIDTFQGITVFNGLEQTEKLVDLIEEKAVDSLTIVQ